MTTLRNLLKKTKKKASRTTDDVLDFDLRKIIFVKFLIRLYLICLMKITKNLQLMLKTEED